MVFHPLLSPIGGTVATDLLLFLSSHSTHLCRVTLYSVRDVDTFVILFVVLSFVSLISHFFSLSFFSLILITGSAI